MGQTQSRVGDDSQPEERIESGVRVRAPANAPDDPQLTECL